ncbi:hypothetical protein D3C81_2039050 [compost metagenome]
MKACASVHSKKLVAMPSRPIIHIQNTAPGPPRLMATATPAMLPAPTRPATLRVRAWKELICPLRCWKALPSTLNMPSR